MEVPRITADGSAMKYICCPFCSKENRDYIYPSIADAESIYGFNYVLCGNCGIAYLNPAPEEEELAGHYSIYTESGQMQDVSEFKIDSCRKAAIGFLKLSKDADRILDIGCGKGEALYCLLKDGYNIEGVDPYFNPKYNIPELNERIQSKGLAEANFPGNHFSAAMLWQVLEHIPQPAQLLEEISRITKSGGRLIISVPNLKTLQHRLLKKRWPGFGPPEHLFVYTGEGLARVLNNYGFKKVKQFPDPIYDQWMLKNSIYRALQMKSEKRTRSPQMSKNFNKAERSLIGMFSFLFVRTEALIGNSATTNMVFEKL